MKNEETIFDRDNNQNEETQLGQQENPQAAEEVKVESVAVTRPTWVKMAGSAAAGLLLGASSVLLTSGKAAEVVDNITNDPDNPVNPEPAIDVPVAHSVNDDMSFSEAFAAARHEVGAGGAFAWHGNVYGTYYAEEWDNMTPEQRADYQSHVTLQPTHYTAETHTTTDEQPLQAEVQGQPSEEQTIQAELQEQPSGDMAQAGEVPQQMDEVTAEVEVLGVVHDDATGSDVIATTIGDQEVFFVDAGGDGTIEGMAADINNDGQITADEVIDISDQGLTTAGVIGAGTPSVDNNLMASNDGQFPDYVNDANVDGYA